MPISSRLPIQNSAVKLEKTAKLHIAVDMGMSRIGFADCDESVDEIKKIKQLPNLTIEGIFSRNYRKTPGFGGNYHIRRCKSFGN